MSAKIDDGRPAFPVRWEDMAHSNSHHGMTLRDWFAGQALAGIIANEGMFDQAIMLLNSEACYKQADAMLAARKGGSND